MDDDMDEGMLRKKRARELDRLYQDANSLRAELVGKRVVALEVLPVRSRGEEEPDDYMVNFALSDGSQVKVSTIFDCCAFARINKVIELLPVTDNIITDVIVEDGTTTMYIVGDGSALLKLDTTYNSSNGYYAFGLKVALSQGPKSGWLGGSTWPDPADPYDAEWALRFDRPTQEQASWAASVIAAYKCLVEGTLAQSRSYLAEVRKAIKETKKEGK